MDKFLGQSLLQSPKIIPNFYPGGVVVNCSWKFIQVMEQRETSIAEETSTPNKKKTGIATKEKQCECFQEVPVRFFLHTANMPVVTLYSLPKL